MADGISIEETNKIRVAIGLKPLPIPGGGPTFKASKGDESSSDAEPGSTLESRQAQGYDNWKNLKQEADAKARREAKNEAIKKARDTARKYAKLEGKGLGEADDATELDTKTWLIQQKRRQKRLEKVRRLEMELAEREEGPDHTAEDLAGVKIAHEIGDFEDGGEQVLTLKDTTIDENEEEGDELENLDLREKETLNERLELKKKKPVYNPNDVDKSGNRSLLNHYDEAIEGKKRKRITLDGQGRNQAERMASKEAIQEKLKALPINLDVLKDAPTSDYVDIVDVKVKKPKKKKAKSTRQKSVDDGDLFPFLETTSQYAARPDTMEIDHSNSNNSLLTTRAEAENTSFVDDEDLQAVLTAQRRVALKKRKRLRPEDLAKELREEQSATSNIEQNSIVENVDSNTGGGLVIDETSEFVANLQRPTAPVKQQKSLSRAASLGLDSEQPTMVNGGERDVDMDRSDDDVDGKEDIDNRVKLETLTPAVSEITGTGLEEESKLDQGIGATLSMLARRGHIVRSDSGDKNALYRGSQKFRAEKQKREADAEKKARLQRERDRASGILDRMSAREREEYSRQGNKQRDQQESRQLADVFNREYKPDIQLKYVDEFGRDMNQKQAFKDLSHQFHGKGSGKQKTEKHLKKIEDEKKKEAMSTLDSSQATGMNNAMGTTARKNRQAGVRLA